MSQTPPQLDFLVLSRGKWDEDKTAEEIQGAIDRFYAWYERSLAAGRMKPGQRLATEGRLVTRSSVIDGPITRRLVKASARPASKSRLPVRRMGGARMFRNTTQGDRHAIHGADQGRPRQ